VAESDNEPRDVRSRKDRAPRGRREDPAFADVVIGFARAVRRMLFGPPPDEPPDDDGLAGSRIPRNPPDASGSGSVALAEPIVAADLDEETDTPSGR
jgi:hypothetical protein